MSVSQRKSLFSRYDCLLNFERVPNRFCVIAERSRVFNFCFAERPARGKKPVRGHKPGVALD